MLHLLSKKTPLLLLFYVTVLAGTVQAQKLKVISYNVFVGMQNDTTQGKKEFVEWIKAQDPDIIAFQEMNKFTQQSLEEMARKYGHPYAVLLREKGYPVAVTSKTPIINVQRITDNMHHGFIVAETKNYHLLVLHLSPHKYWKRREEIEVILQTLAAQSSQKKWLVMGDFNSVSPLDKENYADGKLVERYQASAKKYSFHENLVDGKSIDYDVQQKILDFGLIDAAKENERKNAAALGKKAATSSGARIDYIYVTRDLKAAISRSGFINDNFTKTHSDHKPVLLELR